MEVKKLLRQFWNQLRYLKQCFWSWNCRELFKSRTLKRCLLTLFETIRFCWNCWENVEIKDANWCVLTLFKTMCLKFALLRKCWKQERFVVLNRCFGSWNCWEKMKSRTINGAFWRYLKRYIYFSILWLSSYLYQTP